MPTRKTDEKIIPEIVQLSYPLEEIACQIEESGIPDYYAIFLRNKITSIL